MEKPVSYYDWEQNFKKKTNKRKNELIEPRIINSIGLPHDFFKSYLKLWKSQNMKKQST